ncbi:flagellar hook protein FlgE [Achromobacter sp. AGC78]
MLDSIWLSLSGMNGFSKGLRTISNNVSNMNTPGFKKSQVLFEEQFNASVPFKHDRQGPGNNGEGAGVNTYATRIDFSPGEARQTGSGLDMALDGAGYFMLRGADSEIRYTRAGQFDFAADSILRNKSDGAAVLGTNRDGTGSLGEISLAGLTTSAATPTTSIQFSGYLSSTGTDHELTAVKFYDRSGAEHLLKVTFVNQGATQPGAWKVSIEDGPTRLGEGTLVFKDGRIDPATSKINVNFPQTGQSAQQLVFDFSEGVTSFASGTTSTLTASKQDGYAAGTATGVTFDASGTLSVSYSNGQSVQGSRIALARFSSDEVLSPLGASQFVLTEPGARTVGNPRIDGFGRLQTGRVEGSNVDLSQEFSDLVVMQRGYQAASQTISTANDLIQSLFDLKGRR